MIDLRKDLRPAVYTNDYPLREAIASLGWVWKFRGPIFGGVCIGAKFRVAGTRLSNKDKGILVLAIEVVKQDGTVVQER